MRLLHGLDLGVCPGHPVELALVIEGPLLSPRAPQHGQVLVGAAIARVVVEPVAVPGLVRIAAPRDDVERHPAARELVQGRRLARGERRRHEAGAVGDEKADTLGVGGGIGGHEEAVSGGGGIAHQHLVEVRALVRQREVPQPGAVDGAADHVDRRTVRAFGPHPDHPDELHGHLGRDTTLGPRRLQGWPVMAVAMRSASSPTPQSTEDLSLESQGRPRK
jgi:hypothetical protein